jgi:5-methylcytosine-specific restriction endonuclease McrA
MAITPKYKAYLKSDKWKAKRKEVLERDDYTCQECGFRAWQVHHLTYKNIFNEPLEDLISICGDCHRDIHNKPRQVSIFGAIGKVWARVIG